MTPYKCVDGELLNPTHSPTHSRLMRHTGGVATANGAGGRVSTRGAARSHDGREQSRDASSSQQTPHVAAL